MIGIKMDLSHNNPKLEAYLSLCIVT